MRYKPFGFSVKKIRDNKYRVLSHFKNREHFFGLGKTKLLLSVEDRFRTIEELALSCVRRRHENTRNIILGLFRRLPFVGECVADTVLTASGEKRLVENMVSRSDVLDCKKKLEDFVNDGLLIGEEEISDFFMSGIFSLPNKGDGVPTVIRSVCIPTSDRPAMLERALFSVLRNLSHNSREADVIVCDDSRFLENISENKAIVKNVSKDKKLNVFYIGRNEKEKLARMLRESVGVDTALAEKIVLGDSAVNSVGAARNTLLLLSDTHSVSLDDDTTAPSVYVGAEGDTRISVISGHPYMESEFFTSYGEIKDGYDLVEGDMLGIHERALSMGVKDLLKDVVVDVSGAMYRMMPFVQNPNARVTTSFIGSVGDSGAITSLYNLFSGVASLERLTATKSYYEERKGTKLLRKSVPNLTLSNFNFCMTMNVGISKECLMPPFPLTLRGEDRVWRSVERCINPFSLQAYLPYVILHEPTENRKSCDDIGIVYGKTNDIFSIIINDYFKDSIFKKGSNKARIAKDGIIGLVDYLSDTAELSPEAFGEFVVEKYKVYLGEIEFAMRKYLNQYSHLPIWWRYDAKAMIDEIGRLRKQSVPNGLLNDIGDNALGRFQHTVREYARILRVWPDVFEWQKGVGPEDVV